MMKIILMILLIFFILLALYMLSIKTRIFMRPSYAPFRGKLFAHRGLHDLKPGTPENSMAAFREAVAHGYGIEMDIHLTKDHIPVVFHDDTLLRVCGVDERLKKFTYEELQKYTLLDSNEHIPKLCDVLDMVNGQVPLLIEYKVERNAKRLCKTCNELLVNYKGQYCIESFHPFAINWYQWHRMDIVRGQLSTNFLAEKISLPRFLITHLIGNGFAAPDFVAYDCLYAKEISRRICKKIYRSLAFAWTVKSEEEYEYCKKHYDSFIFEGFLPEPVQNQ